jgi:hypothetical protein
MTLEAMQGQEVPDSEDGYDYDLDTAMFEDPPPEADIQPSLSNVIPEQTQEATADTPMPDLAAIPANNPPSASNPNVPFNGPIDLTSTPAQSLTSVDSAANPVPDLTIDSSADPVTNPNTSADTTQQDPEVVMDDILDDIPLVDDDIGSAGDEKIYTFHRIWPTHRKIFLPAQELPSVIPGETRVPPCTVRYRLPHGLNTRFDNITSPVRKVLLRQLVAYNPINDAGMKCAETTLFAFPKPLGKKDARYFTVDITGDSPAHFELIRNTKFSINKERLELLDVGPPVPANLVTVTLNHLPSQNSPFDTGERVAKALCKGNQDVVCHDVFQRYEIVSVGDKVFEIQDGTIVASVQFVTASPTKFPDGLILETFPGWVEIRNLPYQIFYVGRINHCGRFVSEYRI